MMQRCCNRSYLHPSHADSTENQPKFAPVEHSSNQHSSSMKLALLQATIMQQVLEWCGIL